MLYITLRVLSQVESEHRRQRLLNRAQERGSGVKGLALHVPTLAQPEVPAEPRQQLAHFSLFEEEAAASGEHPEVLFMYGTWSALMLTITRPWPCLQP